MNTAARTKTFLLAALLPCLAAPLASQADPLGTRSDVAMDACVKAFVSTNLEKERPFTVRKEESTSPTDMYSRAYRIRMTAVGKDTGKRVAQATCVVDREGVVLSMDGKPFATPALADNKVVSTR